MNNKFWYGWFLLVVILILGNLGCSTQHSNKPRSTSQDLAGVKEVETFVVAKGMTLTIEKDLVVFASKDIQVDGTLNVKQGVNLALIAQGRLTIHGQIIGSEASGSVSSLSLRSLLLPEALAADSSDWILYGDQIFISAGSTISAPQGVDVSIATHNTNGKIEIKGTIKTPDGRDAKTRNENGGHAGSIEIGTWPAMNKIEAYTKKFGKEIKSDQSAVVKVSGTLDSGNGGNGFNDVVGVENGEALDLRGTNGGNGGAININAVKVDVSGSTISSGDGGDGGNAGAQTNAGTHAPDGKRDGEKGHDLTFVTGNGGKGGNIDLEEGPYQGGTQVEEGKVGLGGKAGSVYASAGNGGPWGKGGNTTGTIGEPGSNGWYGSKVADSTEVLRPAGYFSKGGNGGDSNSPKHSGGDGGQVDVKGRDGRPVLLRDPLNFSNYGTGGKGFNGCVSSPRTVGTDGGDAFQSNSLLVHQTKYSLDKHSFWGGDGGDGTTYAGYGGIQGADDQPHRIGDWGKSGKKCPIQTASILQDSSDGPKVVSLPSHEKSVKLVQVAPPSSEITTGIALRHEEPREPEREIRQGFPTFRPLERPNFEEQIRSIPGQFDPRPFRNF